MKTGFVGRFRDSNGAFRRVDGQHTTCGCNTDSEPLSSGLPVEEVAAKERREKEEAAERERQDREAVEAAKKDDDVSSRPPEHEHLPGEAYGIKQNIGAGDALRRFLAASDALRNRTRKAPPTEDQLARMTPAQKFAALSNQRHGRR